MLLFCLLELVLACDGGEEEECDGSINISIVDSPTRTHHMMGVDVKSNFVRKLRKSFLESCYLLNIFKVAQV